VLLPVIALLRRADLAEVIGAALAARAAGAGFRTVAAGLGRAEPTVRGWLRRFGGRAEAVRVFFTVLLARTSPDPVMPAGAAGPVAAAVSAIAGAAGRGGVAVAASGRGAGVGLACGGTAEEELEHPTPLRRGGAGFGGRLRVVLARAQSSQRELAR